jgi:hypothetical protein
MRFWELLLLALVGWMAIGAIGVVISLRRGERARALRHLGWIVAVCAAYFMVLMTASLLQPQKIVAMGQDQCFHEMCFAVMSVEEVPGFLIQDGSRLVRVAVRVSNRGHDETHSDKPLRAYLVDAQGRRWDESMGISGVRLTAAVPAGSSVTSEAVFKVAKDASGLVLVLTHGRWQPGTLVIGGPDSLLHRRTIVPLGR